MTLEENCAEYVGELLEGIDNGDFNDVEKIPDKYRYIYLEALFRIADKIDGGEELYKQIFSLACKASENRIRRKRERGEKIIVTFLAISSAEWAVDGLYNMLAKNPLFDVSVTNCPLVDRDEKESIREYEKNKAFFNEKGFKTLNIYDEKRGHICSWEEMGQNPDIVIHLSYWWESLPESYRIRNYKFDVMNMYIPYCFAVSNSMDESFIYNVTYNKEILNMVYRNYVNTKIDYNNFVKYQLIGGINTKYSGYCKMDFFNEKYDYTEEKIKEIWKIPSGKKSAEIKKVIIAPHHSFLGYAGILSSTFTQNFNFWLYLAEKYKESISFIFKPHPNLRHRAVEALLFTNYEEYDEYIEKWNALPNAKISENSYLEIFDTSDAMIMDSLSFMAEYLYTGKKLLFLRRKEQRFSELGKKCLSAFDEACGSDYMAIEEFIVSNILEDKDLKKSKRSEVYEECLDYYTANGVTATKYIYDDICSIVG